MALYKHILLATDLQPDAEHVVAKAVELVKLCRARLSVMHIISSANIALSGEMYVPASGTDQLNNDAAELLARFAERHRIAEGDRYLVTGDAKTAVSTLAEKIEADLVVIGVHEYGILRQMFGATAQKVLKRAPCDVLAVRVDKTESDS